jgi:hypothetical protein
MKKEVSVSSPAKGSSLLELVVGERRSPGSNRIVWLRTGLSHLMEFLSLVVIDQGLEVGGAVCSQCFSRTNSQEQEIPDDPGLFLFCRFRQVDLNRWLQNEESLGVGCSALRRVR